MNPAQSLDVNREIARRAYALWEKEGRPHGRDRDHWARAERELGSAPAPAAKAEAVSAPAKQPARPRKAAAAAAEAAPTAKSPRRKTGKPA